MGTNIERRTVLKAGGVVTATAALGLPAPAFAASTGKRVVVLGGGMAGLAVAHELAERGFEVTVFEPRPGAARRAASRWPGLPNLLDIRAPGRY